MSLILAKCNNTKAQHDAATIVCDSWSSAIWKDSLTYINIKLINIMAESSTCVLPDCKTFLKRTFGSSLQATPNFSSALKYMFSMYSLLPFKRAGVSESGLEKLALFSLFNAKHSFSFASCLLFAHRHTQTHDPCFPCGSYLLPPLVIQLMCENRENTCWHESQWIMQPK